MTKHPVVPMSQVMRRGKKSAALPPQQDVPPKKDISNPRIGKSIVEITAREGAATATASKGAAAECHQKAAASILATGTG